MDSSEDVWKITAKFGKEIRDEEFCFRKGSTFLNHGSFGAVPRRIKELQRRILDKMDEHPDHFFRRLNLDMWKENRDAAAEFVNSDPEDLVFVQNATTAINTVLKYLSLEKDECILATADTYPAVALTCNHIIEITKKKDTKVHTIDINYPIQSDDDVVQWYEDFLQSQPKVKVAVIDHISSLTAVCMPIKRIIQVCRKHGVLSLIDGAHAPGQVPLDMKALDPDFYTGNIHKWAFCPRGCAILYIKRIHHDWLHPLVTSWQYKNGMTMEFFMQGTRDDTPYLCVKDALQFYKGIGGMEAIHRYCTSLLDKASSSMTSLWRTDCLQIPKSLEAPCMRMVRMPYIKGYEETQEGSLQIMLDIYNKHDIQIQIMCQKGVHYVRLSSNVYNTEEEYKKLADVIFDMANTS